jgi:hypothetical protein
LQNLVGGKLFGGATQLKNANRWAETSAAEWYLWRSRQSIANPRFVWAIGPLEEVVLADRPISAMDH